MPLPVDMKGFFKCVQQRGRVPPGTQPHVSFPRMASRRATDSLCVTNMLLALGPAAVSLCGLQQQM